MRKLIVSATAAALVAGGAAAAFAGTPGPGPNGHNNYGLCKAFSAGSATGQSHKSSAPPFAALQQDASSANESVAQYCSSATPGGK